MCYKTLFLSFAVPSTYNSSTAYKSSLKWNKHKSTDSWDLMQTIKASRKRNGFEWHAPCFLSFYPITEEINK